MEVLSSRMLIRPVDPDRTVRFYRDVLGLAVYREFPGGTVFFLGSGQLEISGTAEQPPTDATQLWLRVRDVRAVAEQLTASGVPLLRGPQREPWGLHELWVADPDGRRLVFVEVPEGHPMRTDTRPDPGGQAHS